MDVKLIPRTLIISGLIAVASPSNLSLARSNIRRDALQLIVKQALHWGACHSTLAMRDVRIGHPRDCQHQNEEVGQLPIPEPRSAGWADRCCVFRQFKLAHRPLPPVAPIVRESPRRHRLANTLLLARMRRARGSELYQPARNAAASSTATTSNEMHAAGHCRSMPSICSISLPSGTVEESVQSQASVFAVVPLMLFITLTVLMM